MTIAILTGLAFDIETYDGLVSFVTEHLELDAATVTQLPTIIRAAEGRIDRLCTIAPRETSTSVTTTSGTQTINVPTDARHIKNVRLVATNGHVLEQVSMDYLHTNYTDLSGEPIVYAASNGVLHLGPVPDGAYTISITYMDRLSNITEANQSNWLLTENPDLYLYAVLYQTCVWLEDLDAAEKYRAELFSIIEEVNLQGNRYRRSTPMRLRSPIVV